MLFRKSADPSTVGDDMSDTIVLEERKEFAVIRLNRPEKRNAMDRASRRALLEAFDRISDRFPAVVLRFCRSGDRCASESRDSC